MYVKYTFHIDALLVFGVARYQLGDRRPFHQLHHNVQALTFLPCIAYTLHIRYIALRGLFEVLRGLCPRPRKTSDIPTLSIPYTDIPFTLSLLAMALSIKASM